MCLALPPSLLRHAARLGQRAWWFRAVTLGVRALVLDQRGVFLVRHTYVPGWYLPGGGVDRGESAEAAIVRELFEEGGISCRRRPVLHGLYRAAGRDHVACYVVRDFDVAPHAAPDGYEIAEAGFFPTDALPDATTQATRTRLAEVLAGTPPAETW